MQFLPRKKLLASGFILYGLVAAVPIAAAGGSSTTVLTGPSPYASCDVSGEEGTNYLNAEIEPWIAANPSNSNSMIAAWQQDRWSNGGARGLRSAASFDGGRTWAGSAAAFTLCTGGDAAAGKYCQSRPGDIGVDQSERR